jgi:hypothetical protein
LEKGELEGIRAGGYDLPVMSEPSARGLAMLKAFSGRLGLGMFGRIGMFGDPRSGMNPRFKNGAG